MTLQSYRSIPVSIGAQTLMIPCRHGTLLRIAIGEPSQNDFKSKSKLTEFLLADPGLLVSLLGDVSKEDPVGRLDLHCWLTSLDRIQQFSRSALTPQDSVYGCKALWRRVSQARRQRDLLKALQKFVRDNLGKRESKIWRRNHEALKFKPGLFRSLVKSAGRLVKGLPKYAPIQEESVFDWLGSLRELRTDFDRKLHHQKLESMRLLAYGASHEINNPLANIATRAQSLLADELDPKRRHRLSVIYEQAMRAHEMISDMMLFAHPPAINPAQTDLVACTQKVIDEIRPQLIRTSVQCELVAPDKQPVLGDASQLSAAFKCLIANAMEAIGESGEIVVQIDASADGTVTWRIGDDGPGIDREISDHVFDPFFSGREAGRGLGFGLSKTWRIVQMHGGEISRSKSRMGGAEFRIRFPRQNINALPVQNSATGEKPEPKAA